MNMNEMELSRALNATKLFGLIKSKPNSGELQKSLARVTEWLKREVKLNNSKCKVMYMKKEKKSHIQKLAFRKTIFSHCDLWKYYVSTNQWLNMYTRTLSGKQQWINRKCSNMYWKPDQEIPKPLTAGSWQKVPQISVWMRFFSFVFLSILH